MARRLISEDSDEEESNGAFGALISQQSSGSRSESSSSSYQAPPERVERLATPSLSEPPVMTPPIGKIAPETLDAPVSMPQIAYRFGYTFEVAGTNVKSLQERHADRCEALGPRKCRILSMDQSEDANSSITSIHPHNLQCMHIV